MPDLLSAGQPTVAIVGGGITGLCLSVHLNLQKVPHKIYESSTPEQLPSVISLGPNAVKALCAIDSRIEACFLRCATFDLDLDQEQMWFTYRWGMEQPPQGKYLSGTPEPLIAEVPVRGEFGHRGRGCVLVAQLMEEIKKLVPSDAATFEKVVVGLQIQDDWVRLSFQNHPDAYHSVVLACDGVDGVARQIVLATQLEAPKSSFTGDYRWERFMSMNAARKALGESIARKGNVFCGYGGYVVTCPVRMQGAVCVYVLSVHESRGARLDGATPHLSFDEITTQDFRFWTPAIRQILKGVKTSKKWPVFTAPDAPIYFRGRICLLGEAAHAGTPHEDSQVGMYLEDAYLMGALWAKDCRDHIAVFSSFEKVRRSRGQGLTKASRDAGLVLQLRQPGVRDDLRELKRNLSTRQSWVWSWTAVHDLNKAAFHHTKHEDEGDMGYDFCEDSGSD